MITEKWGFSYILELYLHIIHIRFQKYFSPIYKGLEHFNQRRNLLVTLKQTILNNFFFCFLTFLFETMFFLTGANLTAGPLQSAGYQPTHLSFQRNGHEMPTGFQVLLFIVLVCYHPTMKDFQEFSNSFRERFICLNNN